MYIVNHPMFTLPYRTRRVTDVSLSANDAYVIRDPVLPESCAVGTAVVAFWAW